MSHPSRCTPITLRFSPAELVERCLGELATPELRTERADRWDFVCKFTKEAGVAWGTVSKDTGQVIEVSLLGDPQSYRSIASTIAHLATKRTVLKANEFPFFDLSAVEAKTQILAVDSVNFELVRLPDGQSLFKAAPVQPITRESKSKTTSRTYKDASQQLSDWWNRFPSLGVELIVFRTRMSELLAANQLQSGSCSPDINKEGDQLSLMLPKRTFLIAAAPNNRHVYSVSIEGAVKQSSEFWFCTQIALASLFPDLPASEIEKVIRELGWRKTAPEPTQEAYFDDKRASFRYRRDRNRLRVLIKR